MTSYLINVFPAGAKPEVQTTLLTFKNKVHTWQVVNTIESLPATIEDLNPEARWLQTIGADQIESVKRVRCTSNAVLYPSTQPCAYVGFEVLFKSGARGFISHREHPELDALIVGTKGYLHGLAVFRKRGNIVGTPVCWFRSQRSARGYQNPNTAPRVCAAELYARAAGFSFHK